MLKINGNLITENHFLRLKNGTLIKAEELKIGDELFDIYKNFEKITSIEKIEDKLSNTEDL